ncbi:ABC transporter ATP-binding protein [Actinoplanes sp. NPDC051411]|uniref:ABC transporter ATP-binding protein n=1 Tax=Actinoplanes sp. NPDC051411 TaxID=3155522 RepID=UPI00344054B2
MTAALEMVDVSKTFPLARRLTHPGRREVHAVSHVDLTLHRGKITAVIGESGSGKSTIARLMAQLYKPTSGQIKLDGKPVEVRNGRQLRKYVGDVQLILQDPFGSFNPVHTIEYALRRAVTIHHGKLPASELDARVGALLEEVRLTPPRQFTAKYPHELSGGQRQRISIARALAASPTVLLADEPVSMLDVSIRLGVLNLLERLVTERDLALLYITHDIASARYFASTASVMYAGELVEGGPAEAVTQKPAHPYTKLLIDSAPDPGKAPADRIKDNGQPPSLISPPTGCRFHPRCPFAMPRCSTEAPPRFDLGAGQWARCWLHSSSKE